MTPIGMLFLFADRLQPYYGGMENHALHLIRYFNSHHQYPLVIIVTKSSNGLNTVQDGHGQLVAIEIDSKNLGKILYKVLKNSQAICFFNSGRWIEDLKILRKALPNAFFCQRTGGNDIIQASLSKMNDSHSQRQAFWVDSINSTIDALITNSHFTTDRVISIGIRKKIIYQVSGGVDIEHCQAAMLNRKQLRCLYFGKMHDEFCVVSACRFVEFKGLDTGITAAFMAQKTKKFTYFIVGSGKQETILRELIKGQNHTNCVFLGARTADESLEIISAADLVLCPSRDWKREVPGGSYIHTETMGRVALESICTGIPVVASRVGGLPEFVTSKYGFLTEPDSPEQVAAQITASIDTVKSDNKDLALVWKNYSWQRVFSEYIKIWNKK